MNTQETILQLEELKLKGMAEFYKSMQSLPVNEWPSIDLFAARMAEAERQYRSNKKTEMYLKTSKLRYNSMLEDVYCPNERNLAKDTLMQLMDCSFIGRTENILIDGKTGCGKSFLACAFGRQACFMGYRVEYFSMNKFIAVKSNFFFSTFKKFSFQPISAACIQHKVGHFCYSL